MYEGSAMFNFREYCQRRCSSLCIIPQLKIPFPSQPTPTIYPLHRHLFSIKINKYKYINLTKNMHYIT